MTIIYGDNKSLCTSYFKWELKVKITLNLWQTIKQLSLKRASFWETVFSLLGEGIYNFFNF